ncbi:glycoside-pentoside-hexuronide (GPH):cation symporter [Liquorilactobacillus ghanensis]|uniref:glycoside-pentoside-hexuronide (GPH):cation symporter n=1 Tax=Liquorilactobacillus ghanensis TaxID=399370 RepID=UPI0039EA594E
MELTPDNVKNPKGVRVPMGLKDFLGDASGTFTLNILSGLVGQLTYFYTDKIGLAGAAVANVMLLGQIFDAFADLIMGTVVEHTNVRGEKYRPWLFRMVAPVLVLTIMLFTVPKGIGSGVQILYMLIVNILLNAIVVVAIEIPYGSLLVVRTDDQRERSKMGTFRAGAGIISGMIISVGIIPITNMLGGDQKAWIEFASVLAPIAALFLFICYKTSKEVITQTDTVKEEKEEEKSTFKEASVKLVQNKYWLMAFGLNFLATIIYSIQGSSGIYYAKWIYKNEDLVGIQGALGIIPIILGFVLIGPMIKKFGVTNTIKYVLFLGFISQLLRLINPYNFYYNTILGVLGGFATIPMTALMGVITAMSIDYNEFKFGKRMIGYAQSINGFGIKIGGGIGLGLIGWSLSLASYNAQATVLTEAVKQAIFAFNIYAPGIVYLLMFIIIIKFDLENKLPRFRKESELKRNER